MCIYVYPHVHAHINTHSHSSRGGHLHHFNQELCQRATAPQGPELGKVVDGGVGKLSFSQSQRAGTLKDKTQVNFLSFPGNNDNLRPQYFGPEMTVEIKPMSCANLLTFL